MTGRKVESFWEGFDGVSVLTAEAPSSATLAYDGANQLTSMTENGVQTTFSYDAWGRNTGKTRGTYSTTYTYGFGDKIASVLSIIPEETVWGAYNYDGLGKRRQATALYPGPVLTEKWYRWSGWEETGEYTRSGGVMALQTGYVPGLAAFDGANPATAVWRFALEDHLGSPRAYLGQSKAAMARFDFSPYGELMRSAGLPLTVGYTGHLWDPALRQYFAPFRHFNPKTARWNMRDPLGMVDGPNVYAYVAGNPVNAVDPLGASAVRGLPPWLIPSLGGPLGGGIIGGILGGFDQGHCGWGSIIAGAGLGAFTGAIAGAFPGIGGAIISGIMGGIDASARGGSFWSGMFGGALGGVASGLANKAPVNEFVRFLGGFDAAIGIAVGPGLIDSVDPTGGPKPCLIE